MANKDTVNDLMGSRESLGAVHPLSEEESHSARLTIAEMAERWRFENDRAHSRRRTALAIALHMLGEVDEEGKPELNEQGRRSVEYYLKPHNQQYRFKSRRVQE